MTIKVVIKNDEDPNGNNRHWIDVQQGLATYHLTGGKSVELYVWSGAPIAITENSDLETLPPC